MEPHPEQRREACWTLRRRARLSGWIRTCLLAGLVLGWLAPPAEANPQMTSLGLQPGSPVLLAAAAKKARKKKKPEPEPAPIPAPTADPAAGVGLSGTAPGGASTGGMLLGNQRIEFDAQLVKGQTTKAGEVQILERKDSELKSMVKRRTGFRDEIIRTAFPDK